MNWYGDCVIVDHGIDWFTTTATDKKTAHLALLRAENLIFKEQRLGFIRKPWKMAGYSGWRAGRIEFGTREDGCIVRLSSGLADSEWWEFWQTTERCSRIDLQATLKHVDGPIVPLRKMARAVRRFYGTRKDGPTITEWSNSEGGYTLYLGKRASDLYFRGYNKEAQTNLPEYEGCLRLEVEFKKRVAESVIASLLSCETVAIGVCGILSFFLRDRGAAPLSFQEIPQKFYRPAIVPDLLKVSRWLKECVEPSVIRLVEAGLLLETIDNLGLTNFVTPNMKDRDNL